VRVGVREATFEDSAALRTFLAAQGLPTDDILVTGTVYWIAEVNKEVIASAGLEFGSAAGLL
jgi:hypothetical protein